MIDELMKLQKVNLPYWRIGKSNVDNPPYVKYVLMAKLIPFIIHYILANCNRTFKHESIDVEEEKVS